MGSHNRLNQAFQMVFSVRACSIIRTGRCRIGGIETSVPQTTAPTLRTCAGLFFRAGLNWQVVDKKWPDIKAAFKGFDVEKVARFTDADVAGLLKNRGIIRNRGKVKAIIQNAQNFIAIQKRYGSFQEYLDSQDKTNNYARIIEDLVNKFKWLGPSSAGLFLYTVGEQFNPWEY